jgi:hypothetical protein
MTDRKDTKRMVETYLGSLAVPAGDRVDEKVLPAALTAMHKAKPPMAPASHSIWRTIMTSKTGKLTAAAAVAVVVLFAVFDSLTRPAWAIEQTIEAVKEYRAMHMTGTIPGRTFESWMRANKSLTQSQDVVARDSHGGIAWVKNGVTYLYDPGPNTVFFENAITQGFSQWLGPEFLETFARAKDAEVLQGKDPATGRDRVTLLCSFVDADGPQSWTVVFDVASKLPVSFTSWHNLDRSGEPICDASRITYYKDLPDSLFDVHIPGDPAFVEKPLEIARENIDLLSNPDDGLPTADLTPQEAAEKIVRATYQAVIDGDLATLRRLSPLGKNWDDEMLRSIILRTGKSDRIARIVQIGPAGKTGESPLGELMVMPALLQRSDNTKVEEKMIVQFRRIEGQPSCVVYGPYGISRVIE